MTPVVTPFKDFITIKSIQLPPRPASNSDPEVLSNPLWPLFDLRGRPLEYDATLIDEIHVIRKLQSDVKLLFDKKNAHTLRLQPAEDFENSLHYNRRQSLGWFI